LFRVGAEIHAIGDRCSHAEASLAEGELFDVEIECPRHGAAFDLHTGRPVSLPATNPVPVYQTRIEGGDLYLLLADQEDS
jgi:3-phenylpropionate/trans-cinnamate dioxygenase ferredoxin subunit